MYSEYEKEVIRKYTQHNKDIESFFNEGQVIFLNDGYVSLDEYGYPKPLDICLSKKYLPWRYQALLHKKVLDSADVYNTTKGILLDVSCGLGGGVSYYRDYYNFDKVIGMDINPVQIEICKRNNKKVEFINASVTKIPLLSNSIDVITSVEAIGYYENLYQFYQEAHRVLVPGGQLIIAGREYKDTYTSFDNPFFTISYKEDITNNVRLSAAISKYAIANIDPHRIITNNLQCDESLYKDETLIYFIMVLKKNN